MMAQRLTAVRGFVEVDNSPDFLHATCPECDSTGPHEDNGRQPEDRDYAVKCDCGHEWTPNEG